VDGVPTERDGGGSPSVPEARGRSFGAAAADYELGRPGYPERVVAVAGLPRSAEVLDLAAGTGKLTRLLAAHFDRVVAIEPDDALRALIRDAETLNGSAEQIPLPDCSVDGVFCAEAFHWFDGLRAVAEIARVLRPCGSLVVCFNGPNGEMEPAWPEEAREAVRRRRHPGESLGGRHLVESGVWREAFSAAPFEELRFETADHEHVLGTDATIAHVLSISGLASRPEAEREALRQELRAVLPETTWRTPLRTEIWFTRRLA
jgi:SAM-dependent methyltransferase